MNVKKEYYFRSRIIEVKFRQLIQYFLLDSTATSAAQLTGFLSDQWSILLTLEYDNELPSESVVKEGVEHRQRIAIDVLKHQGKIYTETAPEYSKVTLQVIFHA